MTYTAKEDSSSSKGEIELTPHSTVESNGKKITLQVPGAKRATYHLEADNAQEAEAWVAAIRAAVPSDASSAAARDASAATGKGTTATAAATEGLKPQAAVAEKKKSPKPEKKKLPETTKAAKETAPTSADSSAAAGGSEDMPAELTHGKPRHTETSLHSKMEGRTTSGEEWRRLREEWSKEPLSNEKPEREAGVMHTVRVFISSTFVDEHGERDELVRRVFSELNTAFRDRWLQIVPVDLRWGVSAEETSVIQQTCLNEIDNCRAFPGEAPWFIGLRGERYGWVQPDYDPPEDYQRPELFKWLHELKTREQVSITSLEVYHAVMGCRRDTVDASKGPHAFFFLRDPAFKANVEKDMQWIFDFEHLEETAQVDDVVKHQYNRTMAAPGYKADLDELNAQLRASDDVCICVDYHPTFGQPGDGSKVEKTGQLPNGKMFGVGYVGGLSDFGKAAYSLLHAQLDKEYPPLPAGSPLDVERVQHKAVVLSRSENFLGRQPLLDTMQQYVMETDTSMEAVPLVVHGKPGCGKSALMAKFCRSLEDLGGEKAALVTHIVGATSASQSLRGTLSRLCQELQLLAGNKASLPGRTDELKAFFVKLLKKAGAALAKGRTGRPLVMVLDAVNQLSANDDAHLMGWLPVPLPPNVRVIVSTLPEENNCLANLRARQPSVQEMEVPLLGDHERVELVELSLARYHKKLTKDDKDSFLGNQMAMLMEKEEAGSPLYLIAAVEELRNFAVYEKMSKFLREELPGTVVTLFNHLLDRLEVDHGRELVASALALIATARVGLFELEIIQMLADVKWKEEPRSNFSRLYAGLKIFISAGGNGLLQFFHQQLLFIVRSRYVPDSATESETHRMLADYFRSKADPSGEGKYDGSYPRGFSEAMYHTARAHQWEKLVAIATDLEYIAARCRFSSGYELVGDYHDGAAVAKAVGHKLPDVYTEFSRFFLANVHALDRSPDQAVSLAACYPPGTNVSSAVARTHFAKPFLQWLNKPLKSDVGSITVTMRVSKEIQYVTTGCALSPDAQFVVTRASRGQERFLRLHTTQTGQERFLLARREDDINCCLFSPDGSLVAADLSEGMRDRCIRLFDVATGDPVGDLRDDDAATFVHFAFNQDGKQVVAVTSDNVVCIFDVAARQLMKKAAISYAEEVQFYPGGKIAVLHESNNITLYDAALKKGTPLLTENDLHNYTGHFIVSPDQRYMAVSGYKERNCFVVYDLQKMEVILKKKYNTFALSTCHAFTRDSTLVACVSISNDAALNEVNVFDLSNGGAEVARIVPQITSAGGISLSDDGTRLAVAGGNGVVHVVDVTDLRQSFQPDAEKNEALQHGADVTSVFYTADNKAILTSSQDMGQSGGTGRIIHWDAAYGVDLGARRINGRSDAIIGVSDNSPNLYGVFDGLGYEGDLHYAVFYNYPDFSVVNRVDFGARQSQPEHIFFSADSKSAYVFCGAGFNNEGLDVTIVDIESGDHKKRFSNFGSEKQAVSAVCMLADKQHFVVCSDSNGVLCVTRVGDGKKVAELGKPEVGFYNFKSVKSFANSSRVFVGGISSDGYQGLAHVVKLEAGKLVIEKTITEDNEVYDVAVSADDMYLLTASRSGVAVYNSETCEEIVRLGSDSAPQHLAVPHKTPPSGPFKFVAGYTGGHVKVKGREEFLDDDALLAERNKVIESKPSDALGSGASAKQPVGEPLAASPPRNLMKRELVPPGEGAKGRVYIDGKSVVPTSDKLYYRTKWASPDGRMNKNPRFLIEWDDKDGAVTMISTQVVKIGEDGNPDYTDMFMCQAASMITPGETVKYEPGTLMHIHNGQTQMNVACLPPGHYMAAISIVYSGGAESLNVAVTVTD